MYIDSHCHLDGPQFDGDRGEAIARARAAGVGTIVTIGSGTGPGSLDCAVRVAEQHHDIYATVGIHPHEAGRARESDYEELVALASNAKVIGWGEIGLDYHYEHSSREVQQEVFVRQMALARGAGLPIIIHCRPSAGSDDAWLDCLALIRQHWTGTPGELKSGSTGRGILHCFTGNQAQADAALEIGFMISFSGVITFPKSTELREVVKNVPLDRMLIETDSPYLAPTPHRGKRNEPAFVTTVARKVGEVHGVSAEEIGRQTTANFHGFFGALLLRNQRPAAEKPA